MINDNKNSGKQMHLQTKLSFNPVDWMFFVREMTAQWQVICVILAKLATRLLIIPCFSQGPEKNWRLCSTSVFMLRRSY